MQQAEAQCVIPHSCIRQSKISKKLVAAGFGSSPPLNIAGAQPLARQFLVQYSIPCWNLAQVPVEREKSPWPMRKRLCLLGWVLSLPCQQSPGVLFWLYISSNSGQNTQKCTSRGSKVGWGSTCNRCCVFSYRSFIALSYEAGLSGCFRLGSMWMPSAKMLITKFRGCIWTSN